MISQPSPLSTDTDELQAVIASQAALIAEYKAEIEHLRSLYDALRRHRFGRSSEKLERDIAQLEMRLGEMEKATERSDEAGESTASSGGSRRKPSRNPLPKDLPREDVVHEPEGTCPSCGGEKHGVLGEDVTEILEFVPAHFKVIRHVRPKWSCRCCEAIRQAPLPSMPIERGPGSLCCYSRAYWGYALGWHTMYWCSITCSITHSWCPICAFSA